MAGLVATAETEISASPEKVWSALTDPAQIKKYMFGTEVATDWQPGSPITWQGEYEGKPYQDKGEILEVERNRRLRLTHFSAMSGQDDVPENYHTLVYALDADEEGTKVTITQDNNGDQDEADRNAATWAQMLESLKGHLAG